MKNVCSLLCALFLFSSLTNAQECANGWFSFEEGTERIYTTYNKKGKEKGTAAHTVANVDGGEITLTVTSSDGKDEYTSDLKVYCNGDNVEFDMKDFINQMTASMSQSEMEFNIESTRRAYPASLEAGDELPSATASYSAGISGLTMVKGEIEVKDRKVIGKESVTVPAGTFDAVKISYTLVSSVGFGRTEMQVTEWIAKGQGMVRTETMRKGKLESYTELTTLK